MAGSVGEVITTPNNKVIECIAGVERTKAAALGARGGKGCSLQWQSTGWGWRTWLLGGFAANDRAIGFLVFAHNVRNRCGCDAIILQCFANLRIVAHLELANSKGINCRNHHLFIGCFHKLGIFKPRRKRRMRNC